MSKNILVIIVVVTVAIVGYAAYQYSGPRTSEEAMMEEKEETMVKGSGEIMVDKDDRMMEEEMMEEENMMKLEFSGQILAGTESPLLDFSQSDYDKAETLSLDNRSNGSSNFSAAQRSALVET